MKLRALDSHWLIGHLRKRFVHPRGKQTLKDARRWAKELIGLHRTDVIVTPVYLEVLVGARDRHELRLTTEFLNQFRCVDGRVIPPGDWDGAIRIARRLPEDKGARDFADCLIRAIANRLACEVVTENRNFPK